MLVDINNEFYALKIENSMLWGDAASTMVLAEDLDRKLYMIMGEAAVFVVILSFGVVKMLSSYQREYQANKQQRNFMSAVTHELKSPIASLKLQLQTVGREGVTQEQKTELINRALGDTERLNVLVDNILLAAQLDDGMVQLHTEHGDIAAFLMEHADDFKNRTGGTHVIACEAAPGVLMHFDRNAMTSVLNNLLENAVKYAPEGSRITLGCTGSDRGILITVADEGIGIRESDREAIFKKFYRVEEEAVRKTKGTGLGLYIVKELVERHYGSITVRSNGSGKGTIFELRFPNNQG